MANRQDFQDEVLGTLRYDDRLDWYTGEVTIAGAPVEVSLGSSEDGDVSGSLVRAKEVIADFTGYADGAREYAVAKLLSLKNDYWLDEDEEPVTPKQFKQRMSLESIVFWPDGEVTFYHRDGDLFYGHSIEIRMARGGRFYHADIPG